MRMLVLAANWIIVHLQTNNQTHNNLNICYDWNKMRKSNVFLFIFKVMLISLLHNIKYTLRHESCSKLWSLNLWGLYGCCCTSINITKECLEEKSFSEWGIKEFFCDFSLLFLLSIYTLPLCDKCNWVEWRDLSNKW